MSSHSSSLHIKDSTAWVTLERGERNLLDLDMTRWLYETIKSCDERDDVSAIVLTGGGETFCGGADGPRLRETGTGAAFAEAAEDLFGCMPRAGTPIIAAVNGPALAGGFGLVCSCDIVVAVEGAQLGTIEATLGVWPLIAQVAMARRVPEKAAITNCLTGIPFTASRALELGIVDDLVAGDELTSHVEDWVDKCTRAGASIAVGKRAFYVNRDLPLDEALHAAGSKFAAVFGA